MVDIFNAWNKEVEKLKNGKITTEDYESWRYNTLPLEAERTKERLDILRVEKVKSYSIGE